VLVIDDRAGSFILTSRDRLLNWNPSKWKAACRGLFAGAGLGQLSAPGLKTPRTTRHEFEVTYPQPRFQGLCRPVEAEGRAVRAWL